MGRVRVSEPLLAPAAPIAAVGQGSAKRMALGCVNAAGKARQKWYATAETKFIKPGARLLADPWGYSIEDRRGERARGLIAFGTGFIPDKDTERLVDEEI